MRKLSLTVTLLFIAVPACCDGTPTLIQWPGWCVTSTEGLYLGHKHTSFPLTYMFDNNPATTWVFSGTGRHLEYEETGYAIDIARHDEDEDKPVKPVTLDSVWIMNGYNKSRELFLRNNRIVELNLYVNGKLLKTVSLADCMGWHKISIPRQPVTDIKLRFTKFVKGRDDDVCVSEIALYDRGHRVDVKMPMAVEFTEGEIPDAAGQGYEIIDRRGKKLAWYDAGGCEWSPSHRYIAGTDEGLWVVDASTGKVILRRRLAQDSRHWVDGVSWKGEHALELDRTSSIPCKGAPGGYKQVSSSKIIKLPRR